MTAVYRILLSGAGFTRPYSVPPLMVGNPKPGRTAKRRFGKRQ
ncbi:MULTISPECIES: hypothetical protein [unclassified Vibrio]|uniref:Uncharacterized protein n=1 Tax=Vibrio sp. HB236076 TaxID=3232307 RepID=A0AB39HCU2_9VIBR|nr:hypothetical protein [Vibrio sp. HB161653]MDP5255112.1 hypothetical protein [Vibrio sp. HB161653]